MENVNPYETLGVNKDATDVEIKKAYRKMAQKHHPDKHKGEKGAEDKFKEINHAYEVLKDPNKRANYDRFGSAKGPQGFPGGAGAPGGEDFGANFQDFFGDVFSDIFSGGARQRRGPRRGPDLRYDLEIEFNEAAFGTEKELRIPRDVTCDQCSGTGAKKGSSATTCPTCHGSGQMTFSQGFFNVQRTCTSCQGTGQVIKDPCRKCSGQGKLTETTTVKIVIPQGADTGTKLRIRDKGGAGELGGPAGDLYVVLHVKPHEIFIRRHYDVFCEVPISFHTAALGGEIEVPTIDGPIHIKVPEGTQTGADLRLKSKGIPTLHGKSRGDAHIILNIEIPKKLTKEQRKLLEDFAKISKDDTMPHIKNFARKIREMFQ